MASVKPENLNKFLKDKVKKKIDTCAQLWADEGAPMLEEMINNELDSGVSPVEGGGKFKSYSSSYKKKRSAAGLPNSPVQMIYSGEMRDSLTVTPRKKSISIYFSGLRNKELAIIHSLFGAGRSKVIRKLLPFGAERFKKTIRSVLSKLAKKLFGK